MASSRRRCAEPRCRHSPRAHANNGCELCDCTSWLDRKRHTWRDDVSDAWLLATHTWLMQREAVAIGYATEMREFEENHPRPRLADFMEAMSPGTPPEALEELMRVDVCHACSGTGHRTDGAA